MRCAIALVLLGGCHVVFGVDPSVTDVPGDAVSPDGVSTDAPEPPPCISSTPYTMQAIEDTFIVPAMSCNPLERFGGLTHLAVGQDDVSRVLLRFQVPAAVVPQLQGNVPLGDGTLTLTASDVAASTSLEIAVFPLTNEWNEGSPTAPYVGASWCNAVGADITAQTPWKAYGADAAEDRGQVALGSLPVLDIQAKPGSALAVTLPASRIGAVRSWVSIEKGYLSLIVVPTSSNGTLYLQSREANQSPARLELRICD